MVELEKNKWPIIEIAIIIGVLMIIIAIGFTIGILSSDPDGLERAIIDAKGEEWLEGLPSIWIPVLGWVENEYIAGIIGTLLSVVLMMVVFWLILRLKKRENIKNSDQKKFS
jgi:uncharacterized membrane protein